MERDESMDIVSSAGYLTYGRLAVRFETSQPSLHHWVAIGLVLGREDHRPHGLLIGLGRSEAGAIEDLEKRLVERSESMHQRKPAATLV